MKTTLKVLAVGALILTGLAAPGTLAVATPAAAQTCSITKNADGHWSLGGIGTVTTFGDLKIRFVSSEMGPDNFVAAIFLDLKAPGFSVANQRLNRNSYIRYTICGQEVSVTWPDGGAVVVSVY